MSTVVSVLARVNKGVRDLLQCRLELLLGPTTQSNTGYTTVGVIYSV